MEKILSKVLKGQKTKTIIFHKTKTKKNTRMKMNKMLNYKNVFESKRN